MCFTCEYRCCDKKNLTTNSNKPITPIHPLTLCELFGRRPSLTSPHTKKESSPWQPGLVHYSPTRVGLVGAQTAARPHLLDITAQKKQQNKQNKKKKTTESLLPGQPQLGNRNLATSHSTGDWLGEQCSERWIRRSIIVSLDAEGHVGVWALPDTERTANPLKRRWQPPPELGLTPRWKVHLIYPLLSFIS